MAAHTLKLPAGRNVQVKVTALRMSPSTESSALTPLQCRRLSTPSQCAAEMVTGEEGSPSLDPKQTNTGSAMLVGMEGREKWQMQGSATCELMSAAITQSGEVTGQAKGSRRERYKWLRNVLGQAPLPRLHL